MMRRTVTRLIALIGVLALGLTGLAGADEAPELVESEQVMYQRNDGGGCGTAAWYFLSTEAGEGEAGCGYIYGLPLNEVYQASGAGDHYNHFPTTSGDGVPLVLDAGREVTGVVAAVPRNTEGNRIGVGQLVADVVLTGTTAGGQHVDLGSAVEEILADAGNDIEHIEFAFSLPGDVDRQEFTALQLAVSVRGVHVLHGYHRLNGESFITLPTLVEPDEGEDG